MIIAVLDRNVKLIKPIAQEKKNFLLTGVPGCGKSTIIENIIHRISLPTTGFFTREMRKRGRRVGFSITTLDGRKGILAHINIQSRFRVGRYGVSLQNLDKIAIPAMQPGNDNVIVVVDEIGKMECYSDMFRRILIKVLDSANPMVGSISLKGDAFISAIQKRSDTLLIPVTMGNRDYLAEEVTSLILRQTETSMPPFNDRDLSTGVTKLRQRLRYGKE